MNRPLITVSVVSHRQNGLVNNLLADLHRHCDMEALTVVVTMNVPDPVTLRGAGGGLSVDVIQNANRKGFGANHNAAFEQCATPFFCVANPDIRVTADPFPRLTEALGAPDAGVAGPLVRNPQGDVEDSARRFLTLRRLARRAVSRRAGPDYPISEGTLEVDWVAGMFMVFPSQAFRAVGGFDPSYFLYYEDIDLCARLRLAGKRAFYVPSAEIVHDARRTSHRHPRYMWYHVTSIARYLTSDASRRVMTEHPHG